MTSIQQTAAVLYTVGHSNHDWETFLDLLNVNSVTCIVDVRSSPYSRYCPQFNRDTLQQALEVEGLHYVFMGRELGARRDEPGCYVDGQARYDLIAKSKLFQAGLARIRKGVVGHRIALMCSEKDPITCHRMVLVCHSLKSESIEIRHVLDDGYVETNEESERRLLEEWGFPGKSLFEDHNIPNLADAYHKQGLKIAWSEPDISHVDEQE